MWQSKRQDSKFPEVDRSQECIGEGVRGATELRARLEEKERQQMQKGNLVLAEMGEDLKDLDKENCGREN